MRTHQKNKIKFCISKHITCFLGILLFGCGQKNKHDSIELITDAGKQDVIFKNLVDLTGNAISDNKFKDSLAFLILPVQASCPSCRKKTIDSIVKHQSDLLEKHYIIISSIGGRKTVNGFFREVDKELPVMDRELFLDSTNKAFKLELYDKKPTIYYTYNQKAYKKVAAIPSTVRQDLQEFFSGQRNENK
jgi:hypothetical protein